MVNTYSFYARLLVLSPLVLFPTTSLVLLPINISFPSPLYMGYHGLAWIAIDWTRSFPRPTNAARFRDTRPQRAIDRTGARLSPPGLAKLPFEVSCVWPAAS